MTGSSSVEGKQKLLYISVISNYHLNSVDAFCIIYTNINNIFPEAFFLATHPEISRVVIISHKEQKTNTKLLYFICWQIFSQPKLEC